MVPEDTPPAGPKEMEQKKAEEKKAAEKKAAETKAAQEKSAIMPAKSGKIAKEENPKTLWNRLKKARENSYGNLRGFMKGSISDAEATEAALEAALAAVLEVLYSVFRGPAYLKSIKFGKNKHGEPDDGNAPDPSKKTQDANIKAKVNTPPVDAKINVKGQGPHALITKEEQLQKEEAAISGCLTVEPEDLTSGQKADLLLSAHDRDLTDQVLFTPDSTEEDPIADFRSLAEVVDAEVKEDLATTKTQLETEDPVPKVEAAAMASKAVISTPEPDKPEPDKPEPNPGELEVKAEEAVQREEIMALTESAAQVDQESQALELPGEGMAYTSLITPLRAAQEEAAEMARLKTTATATATATATGPRAKTH